MSFFSRYKDALTVRSKSIQETARKLEISTSAIYKWGKLEGCPLTASTLMELAKWLRVNPMWLYDGSGLMYSDHASEDSQELTQIYDHLTPENRIRLMERAKTLLDDQPSGTPANPFLPKNSKEIQ